MSKETKKKAQCPSCRNESRSERRYYCHAVNCTWCGGSNFHICYDPWHGNVSVVAETVAPKPAPKRRVKTEAEAVLDMDVDYFLDSVI